MISSLLIAVLLLGIAAPAASAPAASVLQRATRASSVVAYRGEQLVTAWLGGETQATLVHIEHDPRAWTRLEYRPIGHERRWVILRRGDEEIRYDPATRRGTQVRRTADDGTNDVFSSVHLPLLQANYRTSSTPVTILGRPADRIELRPRLADRPTRRLDVDRATGVVLRSERLSPAGRPTQLTAFLSFEVLPQGWTKALVPPRDLQLVRHPTARAVAPDEAARHVRVHPLVIVTPPGFQPVADYLLDEPSPAWQTVYSDGASVLLVSRRPGRVPRPSAGSRLVYRAGGPVWLHDSGLKHVAHWVAGGWLITMVGEVSPEGLLEAAGRTGVAPAPRLLDRLLGWLREHGLVFFAR